MTDRKLHTEAYREWKENAADDLMTGNIKARRLLAVIA